MRRWKKIVLGVLLLLLLAGAALFWWQKENLKALKDGLQYSSEEIETKLQENQQTIKDAVDSRPEVVIRDVTDEERAALKDGSLSQEELIDRLINTETETSEAPQSPPKPEQTQQTETPSQQPAKPPAQEPVVEKPVEEKPSVQSPVQLPAETPVQSPAQPPVQPPAEQSAAEDEYKKKVSAIIAEVYVLREQYTIELDNMFDTAKAEYVAMSKAGTSKDKMISWATGYISKASNLEKSCDKKMDDVVLRLETLIRENNGDLSLVDTVVYTYANEKSLKKAWYMSELEKRGLI